MKLFEFTQRFPDEASCESYLKAIRLLTSTKNTFSASEMQRQFGHKRYQPIWEMMHKLRNVMGKRDNKYTLFGGVEVDEG